jgi:hypothetical protein
MGYNECNNNAPHVLLSCKIVYPRYFFVEHIKDHRYTVYTNTLRLFNQDISSGYHRNCDNDEMHVLSYGAEHASTKIFCRGIPQM